MVKYKKDPPKTYMDLQLEVFNIKIKQITFQITENCCLNCTYCYQHNKTSNKMTFDIAKNVIDQLLNNEIQGYTTNDIGGVVLDFIGGEPLMEIELIEKIWEYFYFQIWLWTTIRRSC